MNWQRNSRISDLVAMCALAVLTVLFFWKLAVTNQIMVGVDIFTYFYPYRAAVNDALLHLRMPLWNPYLFMGTPLLANGQAGFFYPPNWLFAGLWAPIAINLSVVAHVVLAGINFYVLMRRTVGVPVLGSFVGAAVFGLGGYAASLVEHVNQLQAAAWLPLLLYFADRTVAESRPRIAVLGGAVFSLQLLAGHAQVSFISLIGCGIWVAAKRAGGIGVGDPGHRRGALHGLAAGSLMRAIATLIGIAAVGSVLAAFQLVPMLELARLSIRGAGMTFREAVAFSLPPQQLLQSLLPTYGDGGPVFSEYIAFVGMGALVLAAVGVRRWWREQLAPLALLIVGILLALGVFTPLYWLLFKAVPGFGLFRVPARWLLLYSAGTAVFAGLGIDTIFQGERRTARLDKRWWVVGGMASIATALLAAAGILESSPMPAPLLWATLVAATAALIVLAERLRRKWVIATLVVATLGELFLATRWMPYNQPTAPEAFSTRRPAIAYLQSEPANEPFRILSFSGLTWDPGDLQECRIQYGDRLSDKALYEYIVAVKAKEIVAPNLPMVFGIQSVDGYDGGILPLARYVGLQSLFLMPEQVNPDGRLRERLRRLPSGTLLDLFNVRYVIADKVQDLWIDGIYYDLGLGASLHRGNRAVVEVAPHGIGTALGIVSHLRGAAQLPNSSDVATVVVTFEDGTETRASIKAGVDTADGVAAADSNLPRKARLVGRDQRTGETLLYHTVLHLGNDRSNRITGVSIDGILVDGELTVGGISLIDELTATGVSLPVSSDGTIRLVHSGDVKVYERTRAAKRAVVYYRSVVIEDDAAALARMREQNSGAELILASGAALPGDATTTDADVIAYEAERVEMKADGGAYGGYLLLKDAWYPGWEALVDAEPATIERAFTFFRAVRLPPGMHRVEMQFKPKTVPIGGAITAVGLGSVVLLLSIDQFRRRRSADVVYNTVNSTDGRRSL